MTDVQGSSRLWEWYEQHFKILIMATILPGMQHTIVASCGHVLTANVCIIAMCDNKIWIVHCVYILVSDFTDDVGTKSS